MRRSFLPHVDADPSGCIDGHSERMLLLTKLRMPESQLVWSCQNGVVANRRLTDSFSVDPHFRPGRCVDRNLLLRQINLDRDDFAWNDLQGSNDAVAYRLAPNFDVMI